MKKYLLTLSFLFITIEVTSAQATNIFPGTGDAGIGITTGMTAPLTIVSTAASPAPYLLLGNPNTANYSSLNFGLSAATGGYGAIQAIQTNGSSPVLGNLFLNPYGGKVSVGISTAPLGTLDVSGTMCTGGSAGNLGGASITFLNSTSKMLIGWNRSNSLGETDFIANRGAGSTGGFQFEDYNGTTETTLMYIRASDGNIGVATAPYTQYKLAVNGAFIATSIVVKANSNWPDYVFDKRYKHQNLSRVEAYLNTNHHLPGMPTQIEIEKNGLNLGEANKALTKQVEELTLYVIEKDKEITAEKTQNIKQQQEIDELQKEVLFIAKKLEKN